MVNVNYFDLSEVNLNKYCYEQQPKGDLYNLEI